MSNDGWSEAGLATSVPRSGGGRGGDDDGEPRLAVESGAEARHSKLADGEEVFFL